MKNLGIIIVGVFSLATFSSDICHDPANGIYCKGPEAVLRGEYSSTRHNNGHYHKSTIMADYHTKCPICSVVILGDTSNNMIDHLQSTHRAVIHKVESFEQKNLGPSPESWNIIFSFPLNHLPPN
ncbi:MAG: hypothetical protein H6731_08435 [Myxococcales bacterium]|nr:MAG: hypothetical protein H6731_08435 [Myxococcales bacterium]